MELKRVQSNIGMGIILISWSMLFAALFLGYFVFRFSQDSWPPMGMARVPLLWPSISTLVLGFSSYAYWLFQKTFLEEKQQEGCKYLVLTIVIAFTFMAMQFQLWNVLKAQGLYANAGIFPSLLYGFTWIHCAHIGLGIPALLLLWFCLTKKNIFNIGELFIINLGRFWHFLGVIWLMMFLGLFVF